MGHLFTHLPLHPYCLGGSGRGWAVCLPPEETGAIHFLQDGISIAQNYASMNSVFLLRRHIGEVVTWISVDLATRVVYVTLSADLSSLIPGSLPLQGVHRIAGSAQAHTDGGRG